MDRKPSRVNELTASIREDDPAVGPLTTLLFVVSK